MGFWLSFYYRSALCYKSARCMLQKCSMCCKSALGKCYKSALLLLQCYCALKCYKSAPFLWHSLSPSLPPPSLSLGICLLDNLVRFLSPFLVRRFSFRSLPCNDSEAQIGSSRVKAGDFLFFDDTILERFDRLYVLRNVRIFETSIGWTRMGGKLHTGEVFENKSLVVSDGDLALDLGQLE